MSADEIISWVTTRVPAMTEREQKITGATSRGGEDRRDERLRALFAAADPATDPPQSLQQRVAEMAAGQSVRIAPLGRVPRTRRRLWTPWRIGLGLAGATALALVGVSMAP